MRPFSAVASLGLALLAASAACSGSAPGGASAGDDGGASAEGGAAGSSSGPGSDGGASRDGSASGSSGGSSSGSSSGSSGSSGSSSGSSSGGSSGSSGGGTHCDSLLVTGIASNQIAYYGEGFYGSGQPPQVQVEMTFAYTQAVPNGKLMVSYVQFGTADDAKLDGTHALDPSTTNAPCNFDDTICVALWDGTTLWGPVSGTLTLGDTTTPISEESTGSLANVRLTPLTLNA